MAEQPSELLPCPFCGGAAHFFKITDLDVSSFGGEGICCGSCPITTDLMFSLMDDCKPLLAEKWNRRAALSQPSTEQGWRTIESAPKDGTSVLLFTAEGVIEGYFQHRYWEQCVCEATYDMASARISCTPTHWMPLPPPPIEPREEKL